MRARTNLPLEKKTGWRPRALPLQLAAGLQVTGVQRGWRVANSRFPIGALAALESVSGLMPTYVLPLTRPLMMYVTTLIRYVLQKLIA